MNMGLERWIGTIAGLGAGIALLYYMYGPRLPLGGEPEAEPAPIEAPAPTPESAAAAPPHYPVPEAPMPAAEPAPAPKAAPAPAPRAAPAEIPPDLAASDSTLHDAAAGLFGDEVVENFLIPDRIIQNIVVTVDSLDREPVPLRFRAVSNVPELPVVEKDGDTLTLSEENGARYRPLIAAVEAADAKAVASLYLRYYPLFERAYHELGYPDAYFNDRVVKVIDHLLAAPDPPGPIQLVRPKVLYRYADPALEELSSGQKMMIRIGPDNAAMVKAKLREIRSVIAAEPGAKPEARRG